VTTYAELLEADFKRQIQFNHIKNYHDLGYKGKGIVILNGESLSDHGKMTTKVIKDYAPEATVINSTISGRTKGDQVIEMYLTIDGEKIDFEKAIDKYNIKIVTKSFAGSGTKATLNYFKDIQKRKGVIFFCSAGNDGANGVRGVYTKDDTAIAVGSVQIKENGTIKRMYYSAIGEELDFMSFMARGVGTSAASPGLASKVALLLQRYGDFTQAECVEILKSISIDLGEKDKDNSYGYGLPVLPLTDRLQKLDELRNNKPQPPKEEEENMDFTDVKETDWFYDDVKFCTEKGLMQGDGDNTFDPHKTVTRAEEAATSRRIYEKITNELKGEK
jgi:hypothetical protein